MRNVSYLKSKKKFNICLLEETLERVGKADKAQTAIYELQFKFLGLDSIGWGLGEDAPARVTTAKWLFAINVSKERDL